MGLPDGLKEPHDGALTPAGLALKLLAGAPNAERGVRAQEQADRDDEVIKLRFQGYSFRQIGARLAIAGSSAFEAYQRALRRRGRALAQPERARRKHIAELETIMAPDRAVLLGPPPPDASRDDIVAYAARIEGANDRLARWYPILLGLERLIDKRPLNVNIGEKAGANVREGHVHLHGWDARTATPEQRRALIAASIEGRRAIPRPPGPPERHLRRGGTP